MKRRTQIRVSLWWFAFLCFPAHAFNFYPQLINGTEDTNGKYSEVVDLRSGSNGCSATMVGNNVLITAGNCAAAGLVDTITVSGKTYNVKLAKATTAGLDLGVGIVESNVTGITPATISPLDTVKAGLGVTLLGYGCTDKQGTGMGKLMWGPTVITTLQGFTMNSQKPGGAAICFGDQGGPALIIDGDGNHVVVGINSQSDFTTNADTRLDIAESRTFLSTFASTNSLQICGINSTCGTTPAAPTCSITATPGTVTLGSTVSLQLSVQGQVTAASIDETPVYSPDWKKVFTPALGAQTASGSVTGPGGTGVCKVDYTVNNTPLPPAPTCTLTANPTDINLGQSLVVTLTAFGQVTSATIDGETAKFPSATRSVTPATAGLQSSIAAVTGPGGNNTCTAKYTVEGSVPIPPAVVTNFTVLATYCGPNTLTETDVAQVCWGTVKFSATTHDLAVKDVVIITYRDSNEVILPVFNRAARAKQPFDLQTIEDLDLYTNVAVTQGTMGFVTKKAVLTSLSSDGTSPPVPQSIQGNSSRGSYFIVGQLSPLNAHTLAHQKLF
jgi:hypothetical protein